MRINEEKLTDDFWGYSTHKYTYGKWFYVDILPYDPNNIIINNFMFYFTKFKPSKKQIYFICG